MRYLRNRPTRDESVRAALTSTVVATAVGLVTYYFVRLVISREPISSPTEHPDRLKSGGR